MKVLSCAAYSHYPFCSASLFPSAFIVFEVMIEDHKGTISPLEISSPTRRALNLPVVTLLNGICFPFSGMGIYTKFGPGPFRCPQNWCFTTSKAFCRLLPFGELETISQPPPWVVFRKILH